MPGRSQALSRTLALPGGNGRREHLFFPEQESVVMELAQAVTAFRDYITGPVPPHIDQTVLDELMREIAWYSEEQVRALCDAFDFVPPPPVNQARLPRIIGLLCFFRDHIWKERMKHHGRKTPDDL
jgi:hypothetical protein